MKLSENNKKSLLVSIHKLIEENANHTVNDLEHKRTSELINYPPDGGLTESEKSELEQLEINPTLKSALRKVIASNTADVFFSILNIIDGTAEPSVEYGEWGEIMLVDLDEQNKIDSMLHDDFYGTYWNWIEKRHNPGWKLDLLEE